MSEQLANKAKTTLNGAINNSVTSLVVTSATGFPATGDFRILIKAEGANTDEILTVTAVSGTTFTVTRASEAIAGAQSASSHASGAEVIHVLTAGALRNLSLPTGTIGAQIHHSTTSSASPLPFDTKDSDTDGFWSSGANTKLTIPPGLAGRYRITFWGLATAGEARVRKNGATPYIGPNTPNGNQIWNISFDANLLGNDYIEVVTTSGTWGHASAAEAQITLQIVKLDSGRVGSGVGARVYPASNQAVNNSQILFDTHDYDTDGFHSLVSNTDRFTIPTGMGGKYILVASASSTGGAIGSFYIRKNGQARGTYDSGGVVCQSILMIDAVPTDYFDVHMDGNATIYGFSSALTQFEIMRTDSNASGVLASSKYEGSSGGSDFTTTSASYVDIDSSINRTMTTGARRVLMVFSGTFYINSSNTVYFNVDIDGTLYAPSSSIFQGAPGNTVTSNASFAVITDVLTAGSHTFKPQWKRSTSGTATLRNSTESIPAFSVQELPDSGALVSFGNGGPMVVRGHVDSSGSIVAGSGFTVNKTGTGTYVLTFSPAFVAAPVITAMLDGGYFQHQTINAANTTPTTSSATLKVEETGIALHDGGFFFIAIDS